MKKERKELLKKLFEEEIIVDLIESTEESCGAVQAAARFLNALGMGDDVKRLVVRYWNLYRDSSLLTAIDLQCKYDDIKERRQGVTYLANMNGVTA